ncbi:MAG: hypothetical protein RMJ31_06530 [Nitrososphaerota archaeon]|nr:hypothetical protein [Nitrososphaerales archaeon]MDW8045409.1 hypothetical protein [Nitrososphaerota archaeon]
MSLSNEVEKVVLCPDGHQNPHYANYCVVCGKRIEIISQITKESRQIGPIEPEYCIIGLGSTGIKVLSHLWKLVQHRSEHLSLLGMDSEMISEEIYGTLPSKVMYRIGKRSRGTGHLWKVGERLASEEPSIKDLLIQAKADKADAVFFICSLGGGMGSGAAPYILSMLPEWGFRGGRFILAIMPYDNESDQLHFNAYCGLSRLIKYKMGFNSDLIILVNNTNLDHYKTVDRYGKEIVGNDVLAAMIDMIVSAGDAGVYRRINVDDLVTYERSMKVFHFSPCIALGHSMRIYSRLTNVLESAFARPLMPLDPDSAIFTYLFLRISESLKERMSYEDLLNEFEGWRQRNLPSSIVSYFGLSYVKDHMDKMDVLLLVGGYLLEPFIKRSYEGYQRVKGASTLSPDELKTIEDVFKEYTYNLNSIYQRAKRGPNQD